MERRDEVNRGAKRAILVICTLAAIGLAGYLLATLNPGPDAPVAAVSEQLHDFGEVDANSTLKHSFEIQNEGRAGLAIKRVRIDCACGRVRAESDRIAPGEIGRINLEYDTPNDAGPFTANILIETNDPAQRFVKLQVTGTVRGQRVAGSGNGKPGLPAVASKPVLTRSDALRVVVFYSPTCGGCERLFSILDDCQS